MLGERLIIEGTERGSRGRCIVMRHHLARQSEVEYVACAVTTRARSEPFCGIEEHGLGLQRNQAGQADVHHSKRTEH